MLQNKRYQQHSYSSRRFMTFGRIFEQLKCRTLHSCRGHSSATRSKSLLAQCLCILMGHPIFPEQSEQRNPCKIIRREY